MAETGPAQVLRWWRLCSVSYGRVTRVLRRKQKVANVRMSSKGKWALSNGLMLLVLEEGVEPS